MKTAVRVIECNRCHTMQDKLDVVQAELHRVRLLLSAEQHEHGATRQEVVRLKRQVHLLERDPRFD